MFWRLIIPILRFSQWWYSVFTVQLGVKAKFDLRPRFSQPINRLWARPVHERGLCAQPLELAAKRHAPSMCDTERAVWASLVALSSWKWQGFFFFFNNQLHFLLCPSEPVNSSCASPWVFFVLFCLFVCLFVFFCFVFFFRKRILKKWWWILSVHEPNEAADRHNVNSVWVQSFFFLPLLFELFFLCVSLPYILVM